MIGLLVWFGFGSTLLSIVRRFFGILYIEGTERMTCNVCNLMFMKYYEKFSFSRFVEIILFKFTRFKSSKSYRRVIILVRSIHKIRTDSKNKIGVVSMGMFK